MTVPTLDSLPYELVLRIIETTPFESLLDLAVTSRAFPNPVAVVLYKSVFYGTFKTKYQAGSTRCRQERRVSEGSDLTACS